MELTKQILRDSYAVKITATEGDKVLGWGFLYVIYNDRHPEPYGLIENVYVEQEYRSQGLGTKILKDALQEAKDRGCYKVLMQSRHGKTEVHNFYQKIGFKDHGVNFRLDLIDSKPKQRD